MVLTNNKAPRSGWQKQAKNLAFAHATLGKDAMTPAHRVLGPVVQKWLAYPVENSNTAAHDLELNTAKIAKEPGPSHSKSAEQERRADWESATSILKAGKATFSERAAAANKQIAGLDTALALVREELVLQQNKTLSLQTSLNLTTTENLRLAGDLAEAIAAAESAKSRCEQMNVSLCALQDERDKLAVIGDETRQALSEMKVALAASKAKCAKLATSLDEASEMHQYETARLVALVEAATMSGAAKEKLLADARLRIVTLGKQKDSAERHFADATAVGNAAAKKLELLREELRSKASRIQQLDEVGAKLLEHTDALLGIAKERDAALASAKEQIKSLSDAKREVKSNIVSLPKKFRSPKRTPLNNGITADTAKNARTKSTLMKGELDKDQWLFAGDLTFVGEA